jgi:hypothetical protein
MKSNLAGLYIQIEAKKRRINIINSGNRPEMGNAVVYPAELATPSYLCSKSTGAVTSCTRKYLASAGYFRATASYIPYATLR